MTRPRQKHIFLLCRRGCAQLPTVRRFFQDLGLHPVLLDFQDGGSEAVVERFENYASDAYAVVLLSAHPPGSNTVDPGLLFQLGFLTGRLGRKQVLALYRADLQLPKESQELLCIPLDEIGIWKFAILRDLSVAGFAVRQQLAG